VAITDVLKSVEFWSECGRVKCFSQSSKSNELILSTMNYNNVSLCVLHRLLIWIIVSECDDFEYCDVSIMTS